MALAAKDVALRVTLFFVLVGTAFGQLSAPKNIRQVCGGPHHVGLAWVASPSVAPSNAYIGYFVYRVWNNSPVTAYTRMTPVPVRQTGWTDCNVSAGMTYQYYLTTVYWNTTTNALIAESAHSNTVQATVPSK